MPEITTFDTTTIYTTVPETSPVVNNVTVPNVTEVPETTTVPGTTPMNPEETVTTDVTTSVTTRTTRATTKATTKKETTVETTIPEETTVVETTTTATVGFPDNISGIVAELKDNMYVRYGLIALLIIVFFIFMGVSSSKNKKRKRERLEEHNARTMDAERLAKDKKTTNQKKKTKRVKPKPKKKSVINTLPYIKVMSDDIWMIAENTYSKAYRFADINYNIGDVNQQLEILQNYSSYLNTLDDTIDCQICAWNCSIDIEDFEKDILIEYQEDGYDKFREEYNERVLKENISKGNNSILKRLYMTLTIKTPDFSYAVQKFKTLDLETRNSFERIGNTHLKPMKSQERARLLKDFFVGVTTDIPEFTDKDYKDKVEKIYCSPDYFEFKSDYFMFNNKYAKCVFIKDYPSKASDSIVTDLINTNLELMVTTNIITHDPAKARKLVQRQITAIDTNMAQRESKAAQHGNFSSQMPIRIKNQREGYTKLYDKLTIDDQKLFSVNTVIMITAKSFTDLQNCEEIVSSTLKRNGCMFGQMKYQQEDGMIDCLPVGSQRKFEFRRTMPTESVAIFQPWNVKEVTKRHSTYYGLNVLSNNMITFDRMKGLNNPSGFILGSPGSGKSFITKVEMTDKFMRDKDADIVIIDPEREYHDVVDMFGGEYVKISLGSQNYINPFDFDFNLLDDPEVNVISDKCQLIASFVSCMDKSVPLNAQEISFLDRCIAKTYEKSGVLKSRNRDDIPTLTDFYEIIKSETDVDEALQKKISITIEMYVTGSAKYFNNPTNVNVNNRVICYDIKDLSDALKTQTMLLVLDYIWSRLSANREKGRSTWIYIDEVYLLFADKYCLEYLRRLYKRARKYGGSVTGITQNVEDLLKDDSCRTMLSNSEFLALLKQAPADIIKLRETLKFNDSEIECIQNVKPGQGLLVLGGKDKVPFYNDFPKDTDLYRRFTTSFVELAELKRQGG